MPAYGNPYSDAEAADTAAPSEESQEMSSATAELPRSILAGKEFKPGDEVVLKIVSMTDDSVVVEYATGDEEETAPEEESAGPPPEPASPEGGSDMAAMME